MNLYESRNTWSGRRDANASAYKELPPVMIPIGNAVEGKASIIMDRTHVGHLSYVGDSIIDTDCNFGAGTKVANLRHDGANIKVMIKGILVDSGRRKLGAIMGDNVHTGINSMLNVGSVIEPDTNIHPGEFVK